MSARSRREPWWVVVGRDLEAQEKHRRWLAGEAVRGDRDAILGIVERNVRDGIERINRGVPLSLIWDITR